MPFKSRPNLYVPNSLYKKTHYNTKYGLADYKFYFDASSPVQKCNQGICSSAKKFFIKEVSCKLESKFSYSPHIVKFVSQSQALRSIIISFGPFSIEDDGTLKQIKLMLKRMFARNKRIASIRINFHKQGQVNPQILKKLTSLCRLQSLTFALPEVFPPILDILSKFLSKNHARGLWPLLKSQLLDLYMGLNLPTSLTLDDSISLVSQSIRDLTTEMTSMRGVQTQYKLSFQLLRISDTERIQALIDAIAALPILTYMKFNISSRLDVFRLFEGLRDSRYLREVDFMCFQGIGAQSTTLSSLVEGLAHLHSLASLSVMVEAYRKATDIHTFAENISTLENLRSLAITIMDPEYMDDYFLELFGQSLTRFPRLESLDVDFQRYILLQETTISNQAIQDFFEKIGEVVHLKSLALNFKNLEGLVTEDEVIVLANSLKKLEKISEFQLDISNSPVNSKAMVNLFQVLSQKSELTELEIMFKDCEGLDMETLAKVFHGLGKLRHLQVLKMNFPCLNVDDSLNGILGKALFLMRSLRKVVLVLWVDIEDLDKMENVEKTMEQLAGRMEVDFKYF